MDVQGNNNFSQIPACSNVKGYNNTITCDPQITDRCKIRFPPNCGTILGHREVVYKACYDLSQTYSAMMIYPFHTQVLHLSDNNMTKIEVDAFQSLINLEYLDLHNNELRELDADLFLQLSSLKRLWMYHNMLRRLPPNIFRNLINLEILDISSNELSELNAELFLHLNLLRELTLGYEMEKIIDFRTSSSTPSPLVLKGSKFERVSSSILASELMALTWHVYTDSPG